MVRQTGNDWAEKLTPVEDVKQIPKGIFKLLNLILEWGKGKGEIYGTIGKNIRNFIKQNHNLKPFLTHVDMSGTERVARMELEIKGKTVPLFLKKTYFKKEMEILSKLNKTNISGTVYGYLPQKGGAPNFIIREFIEGQDHRAIDLGSVKKGTLKKLSRSLGKNLRKFHETTERQLGWDSDIIFNLDKGESYFVDFDRVTHLREVMDRARDASAVRNILSRTRDDYHEELWKIFINNYGKNFEKFFTESRLKPF